MAAVRGNTSTATNPGTTTATTTWSHTTSATGGNRLLTVAVQIRGASAVSGITYNGAALTFARKQMSSASILGAELWYLVAPATGAHNIVVTMPSVETITCQALDAQNIDQTTPLRSAGFGANSTGTAITVTVTDAVANDLVVDSAGAQSNTSAPTYTIGAGQTTNGSISSGSSTADVVGASSSELATGSTVMSWTLSASRIWATTSAAFKNTDFVGAVALTASFEGDSSTAAAVSLTKPLTAATAGGSSTAALVSLTKSLSASFQSDSVTGGALSLTKTLSASFEGDSVVVATLALPWIAAFAGTSATIASLSLTKPLGAAFIGGSSTAANVSLTKQLTAAFAGGSTTAADARLALALAAVLSGGATIAANAQSALALSAAFSSTSSISAALVALGVSLTASFSGASSTAANATLALALSAAVGGASVIAIDTTSTVVFTAVGPSPITILVVGSPSGTLLQGTTPFGTNDAGAAIIQEAFVRAGILH